MTIYGDLDVSVIDEMPPGRKPIVTKHATADQVELAYSFMKRQIDEGRQAYVVYPVIEESETQAMKAAQKMYEHLSREVFPDIPVGLMHGRLGGDEKEAVMQRFKEGLIKILVSTTVIEVGWTWPTPASWWWSRRSASGWRSCTSFAGAWAGAPPRAIASW